jgi:hypothetical protein
VSIEQINNNKKMRITSLLIIIINTIITLIIIVVMVVVVIYIYTQDMCYPVFIMSNLLTGIKNYSTRIYTISIGNLPIILVVVKT